MSSIQRIFGYPFALLWDGVTSFRNYLYDEGYRSSQEFDLPLIGVGNLSMGGTGKTPHIEYLIRLLEPEHHVGVLSRGYKRKTNGYQFATAQSTPQQIGDEPMQYKLKYPNVGVAVSESRVMGVPKFLMDDPSISTILLDDVFQHRAIRPGLNILLTDYKARYTSDAVVPAGMLRESQRGAKRADIIIVSKCPADLSKEAAQHIAAEIQPKSHQQLYFSSFHYGQPYSFFQPNIKLQDTNKELLLVTGIAKPEYLLNYAKATYAGAHLFDFPDHHHFHERDVHEMHRAFENLGQGPKALVITEKDAVKLFEFRKLFETLKIPVYVQPIEVYILFEQGRELNEQILTFVRNFHGQTE